jgi:hypothetical protein
MLEIPKRTHHCEKVEAGRLEIFQSWQCSDYCFVMLNAGMDATSDLESHFYRCCLRLSEATNNVGPVHVGLSLSFRRDHAAVYRLSYELWTSVRNFMDLCVEVMSAETSSNRCFLISYPLSHQRDGFSRSWDGPVMTQLPMILSACTWRLWWRRPGYPPVRI